MRCSGKSRPSQGIAVATAFFAAALLACANATAAARGSAAAASESPVWLIGQWTLAEDEDGGPPGMDLDEFFEDGRYIIYGPNCRESVATWHMFRGDIYVTLDVRGKGPIALIFHPNAEHTALTFTSPRTRNNAIYRRATTSVCSRIDK